MNDFPADTLNRLLMDLERHRPAGRAVAAFDADGTLWSSDMGENFFDYKIENKLVPLPADPWAHYNHLKTISHPEAYLWLAQILKGVPLTTVRAWAEQAVAAKPPPIFEAQRKVLAKLKELEVETYIVTASIKWAVEPGARRLGLTDDHVIGIETAIDAEGRVTDQQKGVITYREGKAQAILARTGGVAPYFASGNTEGDKWLLEGASSLRLVMSSAPEGSENWPTEKIMLDLAEQRGWYRQRYQVPF